MFAVSDLLNGHLTDEVDEFAGHINIDCLKKWPTGLLFSIDSPKAHMCYEISQAL